MTIEELNKELEYLQISNNEYSLNGELMIDAINISYSHGIWEVFYFDERGGKHDEQIFYNESDACYHVLKLFVSAKKIEQKFKTKK